MSRGGKRQGAGRPKGSGKHRYAKPEPSERPITKYECAEDYLDAVVSGTEPADAARIAAAKAILPFQRARLRVPLKSSSPQQLQLAESAREESEARAEWLKKSEEVRKRFRNSNL